MEEHPIPKQCLDRIASLRKEAEAHQGRLRLYLIAMLEGMGLDGTWNVDPDRGVVTRPATEPSNAAATEAEAGSG